jgi:hypothetical protein
MSDPRQKVPAAEGSAGVTIDRLIFDVPGLTPGDAAALAKEIGERLSVAGLSGERARLGVTLGTAPMNQRELADRIVVALMERLV